MIFDFNAEQFTFETRKSSSKGRKYVILDSLRFFLSLITQGEGGRSSFNAGIAYIQSDELIDEVLSMSDDTQCEEGKSSFNADIKSISSESLNGDIKSMNDDIRVEEDMVLLEADISSEKLIGGIRLRCDSNQSEESSPKLDSKLILPHKNIEKARPVCLEPLETDHRRATSPRSSLQSPLKQTVVALWQQKDRLDHNASRFSKQQLSWTKDHVFKSAKLSSYHPINQSLVEAIKTPRILPNESAAYRRNIEQGSICEPESTNGFEQDWEIEKVVDTRETKAGREYKVIWVSTWVNEKDMKNSASLISEFWYGKRVKISR